jgi:hypothetical protein
VINISCFRIFLFSLVFTAIFFAIPLSCLAIDEGSLILTTSDTLCLDTLENPFGNFLFKYQQLFPTKPIPTNEFLWWFVGFSEGDGSLSVLKRVHCVLALLRVSETSRFCTVLKEF